MLSVAVPGDFATVGAEVIKRAAGPGHGEAKAFFGAIARGGILRALVESHDDVGAESDLDVDGMFGGEEVRTPVEVRAELNAIVRDFAERAEGEDLEAAGVSEHCARPADELVQAAHAANEFVTGTEIEMVGVAEDDFGAEGFERVLWDGFNSTLRADGHEDRSFDSLVGKMKTGAASAGRGCVEELEVEAHQRILSVQRNECPWLNCHGHSGLCGSVGSNRSF
jgi:hypothetical protein